MDSRMESVRTGALLDLAQTLAAPLLETVTYPWQALTRIKEFLLLIGRQLPADEYEQAGDGIWIARTARVAPTASICGPVIICAGAEIRHCALIRGSALVGRDAVVGNSTELKNVLLFNRVQVPHYNYVGDSILGYGAHMGAGAITSNVKSDRAMVRLDLAGERVDTGLRKFGAILGDGVEVGSNSVTNPGTVIGRRTSVYPLCSVRGVIPADCIVKSGHQVVVREARG